MTAQKRRAGILASVLAVWLGACSAGGQLGTPVTDRASATHAATAGPERSPARIAPEQVGQPVPELAPPPAAELEAVTLHASPSALQGPPPAGYVADYCVARDWPARHLAYDEHDRTVVDPTYMVPAEYLPPDLTAVAEAGFEGEHAGEQVRSILIEDLRALRDAAAAAGAPLEVLSGYRSYAQQDATFSYWVGVLGYEAAAARAARPGHSEHQLGTALDFSSDGWEGRFGDWAIESPSGAWMAAHAWEYGFVMSYPNGGDLATCYGYEPWHYRWIGRDAAADWRASGLTLHEFLVSRE